MPPMRTFNLWVTAIGGIALLFAIIMLFRAIESVRLAAMALNDPSAAQAQLQMALISIKYAILGVPFGAGLAIIGIVGRFKRYLSMLEEAAEGGHESS
jgi:hypothetical protein